MGGGYLQICTIYVLYDVFVYLYQNLMYIICICFSI